MIKNALRGSIVIGLNKGFGDKYEDFLRDYASIAEEIATSHTEQCTDAEFIQTAYFHDSVYIVAMAMHHLVNTKAQTSNTSHEEVQIGRNDHGLLTQLLIQAELQDAVTGRVSFTNTRKRDTSLFVIRNFVPRTEDFNFSSDVAFTEDPWTLKTKGVVESDGVQFKLTFYTSTGEESNISTVIFADGTTNVPSDQPTRIYIRSMLNSTIV